MHDTLILTVSLKSGGFSSELHIPLPRTPAEVEAATERWLDFIASGLRLSAEHMTATFSQKGQSNE